jgi:hypothetical protein
MRALPQRPRNTGFQTKNYVNGLTVKNHKSLNGLVGMPESGGYQHSPVWALTLTMKTRFSRPGLTKMKGE